MSETNLITITQAGVTATLHDVYFSPATRHVEDGITYAIDSSISASSNVVLVDGEAELTYDDTNYLVTILVLEFDEEEDEVDDVEGETAACHLMIDSSTIELEKLAERLELAG